MSAWSEAWSKKNAGNTASSLISGATGVASSFGANLGLRDDAIESYENQIENYENTQFGYGDFDSLENAYNPNALKSLTADELRISDGERATNIMKGVGSGAAAGAPFGWVGAAIGGAAGLLTGLAAIPFGNAKARRKRNELNAKIANAQTQYQRNFAQNAENISKNNFNTAALNLAAFGGMLKSNEIDNFTKSKVRIAAFGGNITPTIGREDGFTNGVTKVNEGGSHELNPNDGVLMGVDPQGVPNLVEEGEVIFNDYVFSNRLYPTGGQLESVKLPKRYEGKSYSDIAWDLQRESEINPLDKISKNTLTDSLMKLTTIQEESRERDREYESFNQFENAFAEGGGIKIKPSKVGTFTAAAKSRGLGVQEFASKVLANKDRYSPEMVKKANFAHVFGGRNYACGGKKGNMFAGPGDESNYLYSGISPQMIKAINENDNLAWLRPIKFNTTGPFNTNDTNIANAGTQSRWMPESTITNAPTDTLKAPENNRLAGVNYDKNGNIIPVGNYSRTEFNYNPWTTAIRAVPVIGSTANALADAFGLRNKEDYSAVGVIQQAANNIRNVKTSPIGRYMAYTPYDINYEMDRLQNVGLGTQRGLTDTASGNALAARNAMIALNNNIAQQMGAARRAGAQYNDNLMRTVQQFNTGIDQFNAQQALQAGVYNQRADVERLDAAIKEAMLMDSIQSATSQARSAEETAALNNWGQWGNDRLYAQMVRQYPELMGFGSTELMRRLLGTYTGAKGGKLNKVREFKKK